MPAKKWAEGKMAMANADRRKNGEMLQVDFFKIHSCN